VDVPITLGSIKINEKAEVIGPKGKVISGLYAGGAGAGGLYGDGFELSVRVSKRVMPSTPDGSSLREETRC
jgi:hypothetical protein